MYPVESKIKKNEYFGSYSLWVLAKYYDVETETYEVKWFETIFSIGSDRLEWLRNVKRNVDIIIKTQGKKREIDRHRYEYAIWRLYRYLDIAPSRIPDLTLSNVTSTRMRGIIGRVFKRQCLKDSCMFKKYFR